MKKGLISLILGAGLTLFSPIVDAQERNEIQNKEYFYNISVSYLGDQGYAFGNKNEIYFELAKIDKLEFKKQGKKFYETSESNLGREKFTYLKTEEGWKFINYDFEPRKERFREEMKQNKKDKISSFGKVYDKDVLVAPDIFDIFEGKEVPDTFKVVVFSYPYTFVKRTESESNNFLKVGYEPIDYEVYPQDKKYLTGLPKILLEKEKDGTYSPFGALVEVVYRVFWFDLNLKIHITKSNFSEIYSQNILSSEFIFSK